MGKLDPNITVILFSIILILSYLLDMLSKRTNIPTVLMLILLGIGIDQGMEVMEIKRPDLFPALKLLGVVGLIMIVLEAALDLDLNKQKKGMILKSFGVAIISLLATTFAIAGLLQFLILDSLVQSLVYAIPLSILSSAIIIPSVGGLPKEKSEFLVYEGTFSDILGIMFFYFLIQHAGSSNAQKVVVGISSNILITVVLSIVVSYALILFFQKLKSHLKLFLMVAVLWLFYSVGKLFHLSSLLIILVFGLILNNHKLFFKGFLKNWCDHTAIDRTLKDFRLVTIESAFVVRTFFFVIFGLTISLASLVDLQVAFISAVVLLLIYGIRYILLKAFLWKDISPQVFIAPRGLITILLFYAIPDQYISESFNKGMLLYPILVSSIIMAVALVRSGNKIEGVPGLYLTNQDRNDPALQGPLVAKQEEEEENEKGEEGSTKEPH